MIDGLPLHILDWEQYDHVWVTVGAGSVPGAKEDIKTFIDLHVSLPCELMQSFPANTHLHLFSSNYAMWPKMSLYAQTKATMEDFFQIYKRPKTTVYRVQSLYGTHKPETTFPGKLLKYNPKPCKLKLPINPISPTPTAWLAKTLVSRVWGDRVYSVHPSSSVYTFELAQLVLGDEYVVRQGYEDCERPFMVQDPCIETPTWRELWDQYYKKEHYV